MKNLNFNIAQFFSFCAILSSCSVYKDVSRRQESKNPILQVKSTAMLVKPIIADLELSKEKKSINYKADKNLPLGDLKANATRVFLDTHKCDYIVDPQFVKTITSSSGLVKEIEYTLTGIPATYSKVYQVDSLPKSIIEYSQIKLPNERVEFSTLKESNLTGTPLGMEFATGLNFTGAQIDYSPKVSGLKYYFGIEKYFLQDGTPYWGSVTFDEIVNDNSISQYAINYGMISMSIGIFKEKEVGKRAKIRGGTGLNVLEIEFLEPLINTTRKTSYDGARNIGLRFGAALDFNVFHGFSIIGRAHSNLGLINTIRQSGENKFEIQNIKFEEIPLVNLSVGARFAF